MQRRFLWSFGARVVGAKLVSSLATAYHGRLEGLTVGVLEIELWVKTHIFCETLGSGVLQVNGMACRYLQWAILGLFYTWEGWCRRGWEVAGRGQLITARITVVRRLSKAMAQC